MLFECQNLRKSFSTRNGPILALEDVTFRAEREEFLCIAGPSGCGKSTLLKVIAGLLTPSAGSLSFDGSRPEKGLRTALVFQEHGLFPWMTLLDNVAFGLEMQGVPRRERRTRAREFLGKVGLQTFADNYPHQLSVGMRQRANIARAFLADPQILLMDEPLGSLDAQTKVVLQEELLRIWKQHRKLVVYVTHDIREAVLMGDRVLVMSGHPGRIREQIEVPLGRPRDLTEPADPAVNKLVRHIWEMLREEVRDALWMKQ
ncbi:MAG: ABC transporter ATP-binding protein [Candidatus Brocadiia bacterium]